MGHVFRRVREGLLVTLFLAAFSTVVVLLTELLDPAARLQHHHLRDCDDHPEEIWILEALQKQRPSSPGQPSLIPSHLNLARPLVCQDRVMLFHQGCPFTPLEGTELATESVHLEIDNSPPTHSECSQLFFLFGGDDDEGEYLVWERMSG